MNKKSILYIFVVLMALSLTLSAVSAEDAVADDIVAAEEAPAIEEDVSDVAAGGDELATASDADDENVILAEPAAGESGNVVVIDPAEIKYADLETTVKVLDETPFKISWGVTVTNHGPDVAKNTLTQIGATDNMMLYNLTVPEGTTYYTDGFWAIGDMNPGEAVTLVLDALKTDYGPYSVEALTLSDSFDPVLSNNYDVAFGAAEPAPVSAASEKTMPAAGNPIAMALLALIAIAGTTISRRF